MTEQQNRKYQEYVPDYEIIFAGYKKNRDYCLVIPVINEGNRVGGFNHASHTTERTDPYSAVQNKETLTPS